MPNLRALVAGITIAVSTALACGGDNKAVSDDGGIPDPISGVGPGISISEALSSGLDGPLLINGFLVIRGGEHDRPEEVRLCEALAESFPPQCGGRSLVVEGLDLKGIDGISSEGPMSWSDQLVQVLGTLEGEVLTISATVQ